MVVQPTPITRGINSRHIQCNHTMVNPAAIKASKNHNINSLHLTMDLDRTIAVGQLPRLTGSRRSIRLSNWRSPSTTICGRAFWYMRTEDSSIWSVMLTKIGPAHHYISRLRCSLRSLVKWLFAEQRLQWWGYI